MTEDQIKAMLAELVCEIDYDIYKEMFTEGYISPDQTFTVNRLVAIVKEHLQKGTQND